MKVLFLSQLPPQEVGRADAYNTRLTGLRQGLENLGVHTNLLSLRTLRFNRPHMLFPLNAKTIARQARGFDVIHAAGSGATVTAFAASMRQSRPVIFDVHGDELQEAKLEWRVDRSFRQAYLIFQEMLLAILAQRLAYKLLVISEPFRERYQEKGVAPERIFLVRNGVDTSAFKPSSPKSNSCIHICYAGGFQTWQDIDMMVDAFIQTAKDNVHFHLIGFSPQDQKIKANIATHLKNHITLEDWLPSKELIKRLGKVDILVIPRTTHPAMHGGCPSKFAEYLAMGKPVIVTNVDETAEFVRQYRCGLVCEPSAKGLAQAIQHAATWSSYERQKMGERARQLAESVFDWEVIARDYLNMLQNTL